jgi:TRAP-type C4-dicarboxylate transport system substrate-binding protein
LAQRDAAQELRVLQAGGADLAAGSALAWSDRVPALGAIALPGLAPTAPELDAVLADATVRARLAEALAAQGAVLVALAPLGHRVLATTRQPVRSPADLAGASVRVPTTALVIETYTALGAKPAVLAFAEAQAALAAGTLDGQDATATALVAARAWGNGLVHATQWGAFADAIVFAVRREVWDGWPEALRVAAREAAEEAARDAMAPTREDTAVADLAQNGVAVLRPTPAGRAAFRAAVDAVYARWTPVIGAALVEAAVNASRRAPPAAPAPGPAR